MLFFLLAVVFTVMLYLIMRAYPRYQVDSFHAVVFNLPADGTGLAEGAIVADGPEGEARGDGSNVGRNSFMSEGWLPPDPPPGHGVHDYVFQLFALSEEVDVLSNPGRAELTRALKGRVLAAGLLVGTYSRDEPSSAASVGTIMQPAAPDPMQADDWERVQSVQGQDVCLLQSVSPIEPLSR